MMVRLLKKLLVCTCITLIIINFTFQGLSFAEKSSSEILRESYESSFTSDDDDGGVGEKITEVASGLVGLLTYPHRLLAIAASTIIQTLGAAVATMEGTTDSKAIVTLTPDDILFNKIYLTDINFFEIDSLPDDSTIKIIREQIAMWYYVMRTIAVIILLIILIVVGIRMAITTVASEKAIYKKALFDWATSLALVFLLHYLIRAIIWINEALVNVLDSVSESTMSEILEAFVGLLFHVDFVVGWSSVIIYLMLTIQTLMFLITYIKRMLTLAFLIIISPLITITYSLDKMGDQKAQALNTWLKEFSYNVLIQPFHCILYLVFVSTAILAATNQGSVGAILLSMLCMKFVWDGEKIVKKIFGFDQASSLGAVAASGAMIGAAIGKAKSAGSAVKSGVKFAKNTKTGQMLASKMDSAKTGRLQNKAAKQVGGPGATYSSLNKQQKAMADKRVASMKEKKSSIRKIKERNEYNRLKKSGEAGSEAELRNKAAEKVKKKSEAFKKDHPLRAAMLEDGKKFTRNLVSPEKTAKVAAAVMAGAAMYALPEQNLIGAATMGYAAGKSVETGIRNLKERKKENFEENVLKAWDRHCSINNIPEDKRNKENFDNWYNNTYSKGKNMDAYSNKNMNKEQGEAEKELKKLGLESDIDSILAKIQKAVLNKEGYNPSEMFQGYGVSASAIAAAVQGYANKYNESYVYKQSSSYNDQMNPYGVTHDDAISGISEDAIRRSTSSNNTNTEVVETSEIITEEIVSDINQAHTDAGSDDPDEILSKLEANVNSKMDRINADIQTAVSNLESTIGDVSRTSDITSQIQNAVNSAMSSAGTDVNSAISSAVRTLGLSGDSAIHAQSYGERYVEKVHTEREKLVIENRETIKQEIIKTIKA